jgi:hypothetical protein
MHHLRRNPQRAQCAPGDPAQRKREKPPRAFAAVKMDRSGTGAVVAEIFDFFQGMKSFSQKQSRDALRPANSLHEIASPFETPHAALKSIGAAPIILFAPDSLTSHCEIIRENLCLFRKFLSAHMHPRVALRHLCAVNRQ